MKRGSGYAERCTATCVALSIDTWNHGAGGEGQWVPRIFGGKLHKIVKFRVMLRTMDRNVLSNAKVT
jgi:hypothetical protein